MIGKARCSLSVDNASPVVVEDLSAHKAAIRGGKEYITGSSRRPMGVDESWSSSSFFIVLTTRGVQIGPGATPFTRIPLLTSSVERARVNVTIALLVEI